MNTEDPRWEEYERRFRTLAEGISLHKGPRAELASARVHLFLYGDNAMTPEQEFETLGQFEAERERLQGLEILTSYWEDVVLYLP
ncbi:MAG TPA: hypothetical protein V6C99_08910 [Oculatellaceae cyanobacterium]|jgi:hypothetical protein